MSNIKYHTEAVVLLGFPSLESSKTLYLLTKDFGLIIAHARAVREHDSKLRYGLQDLSHAHVDLVAAKHGWKVVSAVPIGHFFTASCHERRAHIFPLAGRVANLLKRLLKGEEKNELLFNDVVKGFALLSSEEIAEEDAGAMEVVLVMRILNHLGYWGDDATLSPFLAGDVASKEHIERIKKEKQRAILAINKALAETQL
mgnify:CR=1 FL=1